MAFWSRPQPESEPEPDPTTLSCSFCGKSQREVHKLVAGPGVYICNECIALSKDIVDESEPDLPRFPETVPTAADLALALHGTVVGRPDAVRTVSAALAVHLAGGAEGARGPVVCVVGPTGAGKSTLARAIAACVPVPATCAALNRVTASGYVGEDLENLLFPLLEQAAFQSEVAGRGVVVLDNLHEVREQAPPEGSRVDIGGRAVQRHLLSLLDGAPLEVPHARTRHPQATSTTLNTAGVGVVLTVQLDDPDPDPTRCRQQLVDMGLRRDLVARIDLIALLRRRDAAGLAEVWRAMWAADAALRAALGELEVDADVPEHLGRRAASDPGGAWLLHRARGAVLAWLATDPQPRRLTVAQLEALGAF